MMNFRHVWTSAWVLATACLMATSTRAQSTFWQRTSGPQASPIVCLGLGPDGDLFAGTLYDGVFRTTDWGDTWTAANTGLMNLNVNCLSVDSNGCLYAGTYAGLFSSTDAGAHWLEVSLGAPGRYVSSIAFGSSNIMYLAVWDAAEGGVYRSTDHGGSWTGINNGLTTTGVQSLATDSEGRLFAGTDIGVFRSVDAGESWSWVSDVYYSTVMTKSFAVSPAGYVFAATHRGIFRSTEAGTSWVCVALTDLICRAVAVNSLGHVFASSCTGHMVGYSRENGVTLSTDNGVTWNEANGGLLDSAVTCLAVDSFGYLYAGTETMGVFRSVLPTTGVRGDDLELPAGFSLSQNYPNPFNPSTTMRYAVPARSALELTVFNALGQHVRALVRGEAEAGYNEVTFDAAGLPSGVYFCRLKAGTTILTRKMLLVR